MLLNNRPKGPFIMHMCKSHLCWRTCPEKTSFFSNLLSSCREAENVQANQRPGRPSWAFGSRTLQMYQTLSSYSLQLHMSIQDLQYQTRLAESWMLQIMDARTKFPCPLDSVVIFSHAFLKYFKAYTTQHRVAALCMAMSCYWASSMP